MPPSLRLTILRRVSFLSQETLNALKVGSVLGSTFAVQDLAVVPGYEHEALLPLLEDALAAKILVEEDGRVAFGHNLVRDAIYEDVPLDLRRACTCRSAAGWLSRVRPQRKSPPTSRSELG